MKKRIKVIFIALICAIVILILSILGIITVKGLDISEGRYLEAKNGVAMIILDNSPIQMSNRTNQDLFGKLETGDTILILHDGIAESYPGKTGVYAVFKQEDGTIDDIPQAVISNLTELGWLDETEATDATRTKEELDVAVSYANWTDAQEPYFGALNTDKLAVSITEDMVGWFITVAVADDMIEKCDEFDADFNNGIN